MTLDEAIEKRKIRLKKRVRKDDMVLRHIYQEAAVKSPGGDSQYLVNELIFRNRDSRFGNPVPDEELRADHRVSLLNCKLLKNESESKQHAQSRINGDKSFIASHPNYTKAQKEAAYLLVPKYVGELVFSIKDLAALYTEIEETSGLANTLYFVVEHTSKEVSNPHVRLSFCPKDRIRDKETQNYTEDAEEIFLTVSLFFSARPGQIFIDLQPKADEWRGASFLQQKT